MTPPAVHAVAHARLLVVALILASASVRPLAQEPGGLPHLTAPVNDFAGVIEPHHAAAIDRVSRALQAKTGDAIVVATVQSIAPYADVREYAVKLFENHGRGIGEKGKDNGLLVVFAQQERQVWIEVGYGLEPFVTDGFAGETFRVVMQPRFRQGQFGAGLEAGVLRLASRIAERRGVTLEGAPPPRPVRHAPEMSRTASFVVLLAFILLSWIVRRARHSAMRRRRWGRRGTWSRWDSGIGPFGTGFGGGFGLGGGGFGGGFGGFGGGGGFGGFGGGRSGGGGGGGSW